MIRSRTVLARAVFSLLLAFVLLPQVTGPQGSLAAPQRVSITLLGTTDLHGNLAPVDYFANRPANRGLAKIATLTRRIRAEQPNVLLLDSGDTIQGTPLAFYFARKEPDKPNPTIALMNALHYDAMTLGNHEFNFGLDNLWRAKREAKFPILAANVRQEYAPDSISYFRPYIIKTTSPRRSGSAPR